MKKETIDKIIESNPILKSNRRQLEAMKPGNYCMHRSWGLGCIKSYSFSINKLIIDFENNKKNHAMDPVFCVKKLDILSSDNLLVRQCKEPSVITNMVQKNPCDIIVNFLLTCQNNSAHASEIERTLIRIIGPIKYKKWWTQTKKLLIKDPRVAVPIKKQESYILRDHPLEPEKEIIKLFFDNKDCKQKIVLAEKLYQISSDVKNIQEELSTVIDHLTELLKKTIRINQADRLYGVWVRNDLASLLKKDINHLEPSSVSLIKDTDNLSKLAEQLPSSYLKRFLKLITFIYNNNWESIIINLFRNSSGKFTQECAAFLTERTCKETIKKKLKQWLSEQTIKGPVIFWILKNRNSRKYKDLIEHLIKPCLLNAALYAIDYIALHANNSRRIPLADLLSDDHNLISDLLAKANNETAHDLAQTLLLNQGFEPLTKKSLLARFIKSFPKIQKLVTGENKVAKIKELFVSQGSLDKRKKEYAVLIHTTIPENKKAIEIAREYGDLRENAEYKMARQDQETLIARKTQIEIELSQARVITLQNVSTEIVGIGSIVDIQEISTGKLDTYTILGAWDGNPATNIVSYQTPLSQKLLGKSINDSIILKIDDIETKWKIKKIKCWIDKN